MCRNIFILNVPKIGVCIIWANMLIYYDYGLVYANYFIDIAISSSDYKDWNDWITANN